MSSKCLLFKGSKFNAYNYAINNNIISKPEDFDLDEYAEKESVNNLTLYKQHTRTSPVAFTKTFDTNKNTYVSKIEAFNEKLINAARIYGLSIPDDTKFITVKDEDIEPFIVFNDKLFSDIDERRKELGLYEDKLVLNQQDIFAQPEVTPTEEIINIKPGVEELFNENPELASVGTPQQYSAYLDTIFPDSKVKDIVYHGTNKDFTNFESGKGFWGNAFYTTTEKGYANSIAASRARQEPGTSKVIKPLLINANNIEFIEDAYAIDSFPKDIDTILTNIEGGGKIIYAIKNPEQIHILGNKQDIEEFKKFVKNKTVSYLREPAKEFLQEKFESDLDFFNSLFLSVAEQENIKAQEIATKIANKLSSSTGVSYQMISAKDAIELTKNTKNPWNGEPAFFFEENIYFIENGFTLNSVLHEYSHPFVKAIRIENPTLYNNIYKTLISSAEGQMIFEQVSELYPDIYDDNDLFKDEILVRALEKAAFNKVSNQQSTSGFKKFLQNIIYAIKQMLRKLYGPNIKVEKLSETSTIDELSDMLLSENFVLTTEIIKPEDVVQYMRSNTTMYNDLANVDNNAINNVTNRYFTNANSLLSRIRTNKNYSDFVEAIKNESGRTILKDIVDDLRVGETLTVNDKVKKFKDELDKKEKQIKALVRSTIQTDIMLDRMINKLSELNRLSDTKEVINNTFYYDLLIRNWDKIVNETINSLIDAGLRTDSSLFQLYSRTKGKIEQADRMINSIYKKGVGGVLEKIIEPLSKNVDEYFEDKIKTLEDNKAPKSQINATKKEWNRLKLNRASIDDYLSGMRGDVNSLSAYIENFSSSPDPIISSFSVFLDNAYTDVQTKSVQNRNSFFKELLPALKSAGYSDKNVSELMEQLIYEDNTFIRDNNGDIVEYKKLTLLNQFKNFQGVVDKFILDIEDAKRNNDLDKAQELNQNMRGFFRDYMHDQYVSEFYEKDKIYDSALGRIAYQRKMDIIADINDIDKRIFDDLTEDEAFEQKKVLWKKYSKLASLRDDSGNMKIGDELELAKIEKQYREDARKFYESKEINGLFQFKYNQYKQDLIDRNLSKQEMEEALEDWILSNTRVKINDSFYEKRKEILDKIERLLKALPEDVANKINISNKWKEIIDLSIGFRNEDNQIVGSEMSESRVAKIKELQEEINALQANLTTVNGLSRGEFERYNELYILIKSKKATPDEKVEYGELKRKRGDNRVEPLIKQALNDLFAELGSLQYKEPTDDYIDVINSYIQRIDPDKLVKYPTAEITKSNADLFLKPGFLVKFFKDSPGFKEWFLANHIKKEVYNPDIKQKEVVYERTYIWSVITPTNIEDYSSYTYNDVSAETGDVTEKTIYRIPTNAFYTRLVKKEYRTGYDSKTGKVKLEVGKHVDNRGNWLPRTLQEGAKDDLYINKAYDDLKKNSPEKATVLEIITKYTLQFQEDKAKYSRLYLDIPRFRKLKSEIIGGASLSDSTKKVRGYVKDVYDSFVSAEDDFEEGLSYDNQFNLVRADMFDEEISSIPVQGLYRLETDKVSRNVPYSLIKYMYSLEHQKKLIELNPIAQALQKVVNDPENGIKDTSKVNAYNWVTKNIKSFVTKPGKNYRAEAINTLIERDFKGKTRVGWLSEKSGIQKVIDGLQSQASFGMFAFNIFPSAIKNYGGAITQMITEAGGGKYLNKSSYALGQVKAFKLMTEISANIYNPNPETKSVDLQLVELFDPIKGRFEERLGTEFGRSVGTDAIDSVFLFGQGAKRSNGVFLAPRKWLENEGTLSLYAGMLEFQKIPQTINGKVTYISYGEAWEKGANNIIKLKEGIDPKYDIGGEEFKRTKNRIQDVSSLLQGAYGDNVALDRYAIWRMFSALRRFFTRMFVNSWSPTRYNMRVGNITDGYMLSFLKLLKNLSQRGVNGNLFLTEEEGYVLRKVMTHASIYGVLSLIIGYLFNYDPDDEDRFEKMRRRSGDLLSDDFNAAGWLTNHLLVSSLGIRQEAITFINPKEYVSLVADGSSPTLGPIASTYYRLSIDGFNLMMNDNRAYYKRDVGPYSFQKEGEAKVIADIAYLFGITGSQVDPVKALKGFEYQITR